MAKKPTKPAAKKKEPEKKARVHKELEGFEIKVNPLGEITSNYTIEEINQFLGRHVRDKKIVNREGQFGEKKSKSQLDEEDQFPIEDGHQAVEPEESEEDFMRRTSREAKRRKDVADPADEAAQTRQELPGEEG